MEKKFDGLYLMRPGLVDHVYGPEHRERIERRMRPLAAPLSPDDLDAAAEALHGAQVIFSSWGMPRLDEALLDRAPRLEAVFYAAGAIGGFMTHAAWRRGVRVSSAYAANAVPVVEFTAAHIFLALKQYFRFARAVRERGGYPARWAVPGGFRSTVGLVSLGMIGKMVLERLRDTDVKVIAYDPLVSRSEAAALGAEPVELGELFERSDVVSLHAPLLKETTGMITGEHLGSMKPGATFINTSRGAVVREPELIEVAQRRDDLQFILDVTYPEPPATGSPLYSLPNVSLTPHIAGSMSDECRRMGWYMVEEFERYAAGQPMRWEIGEALAASSTHRVAAGE